MAKKSKYVNPYSNLDSNNLVKDESSPMSLNLFKGSNNPAYEPVDTGTSTGFNYEKSSYDPENIYSEQLPILNDIRANNQGILSSLGNSAAKFVGKTGLYTIGGIA